MQSTVKRSILDVYGQREKSKLQLKCVEEESLARLSLTALPYTFQYSAIFPADCFSKLRRWGAVHLNGKSMLLYQRN
ncbi:hypothetical protein ACROYT_G019093 [Oculina patagonica]